MKNYKVMSSAGVMLDVNYYEAEGAKGLVQILHGMQEHKQRYDGFARFLAENGYSVLVHDHLGHGKSVSEDHPLGDMVSFDNVVKDIDLVRRSVDFSGEYICFGHSMGSFLARIYSALYPVDRLIASGTGQTPTLLAGLLKILLKFDKSGVPLPHIQKLVLGPMGKKFKDPADWLSYNRENQRLYAADPLCGQPFTREGYETLMDILIVLNRPSTYRDCRAKSILLISGEDDPVGDFGKGVKAAEDSYRRSRKKVRSIIYKGMTHEILNETEADKVRADIMAFLQEEEK